MTTIAPTATTMPRAMQPQTPQQEKAMKLAVEFESFFLYQMLELSGGQPNEDGLFAESFSGGIYDQMMNEQLAAKMAESNSIGLADAVYRQLIAEQERTYVNNTGEPTQ